MTRRFTDQVPRISRRSYLMHGTRGLASIAMAGLLSSVSRAETDTQANPLSPRPPQLPARARRVIFICMNGGPSHVDLFDYKPKLNLDASEGRTHDGKATGARLMGSPFDFAQHGESGLWISSALPQLSKHADELCVIRSMHTDLPNHSQAFGQMHTGSFQFVRPSLGAWTLYGLGTENSNLPGFVTINPPSDNGGAQNYGSAFLPAIFQGTRVGTNQIPGFYAALLKVDQEPGPPLSNVENPFRSRSEQRQQLDLIQDLNRGLLARAGHQPEVEGVIQSFELAYRMQDELPDVLDLKHESPQTLERYGIGSGLPTDRFGRQCLLARRLAESGVRFVEITSPVGWDHHFMLKEELQKSCEATDLPVAALLTDLREHGLLDDTLVIWAGEFGRTPYAQSGTGRDHNNKGYSVWMAGGGVRSGLGYGATDDYGYEAVDRAVHIHDWHATILHLLGLDHTRLTYKHAGRDFRLTDVHGNIVSEIIS